MKDRLSSIAVLLIEDSPTEAMLVKKRLAARSHPSFRLYHESTLAAGMARLKQSTVDVVVLDLTLPDSSGLDTFLTLRATAGRVPIVILSGVQDEQLAVEAVRRGAQEFFHKDEMITESLGRLLQYAIERFHRQEAEYEIESAGIVQSRLFPKRSPSIPGFDIAGRCVPANHVGGDYFDYFVVRQRILIVVMGDVCGHGLGPSLVMAETRAAIRTAAATTRDVGVMLRQANELLYEDEVDLFMTLFLCRIDTHTGALSYASAGHPGEVLRRTGQFETLSTREPPLGIEDTQFEVRRTKIFAGDTLYLHSDGITERASASGEDFGLKRIRDVISNSAGLTAESSIDHLFDQADSYADHRPATDDMSAIIVKVCDE